MLKIIQIDHELDEYLKKHQLKKKWAKAKFLLETQINYPGLNIELLEPKDKKIYSFRLDKKYRGIFLYQEPGIIEIITFTNHYT